ncbi:MAG: hypothetical protein HRU41_36930 [Saprospiraceae bacterium]|nr:hypothetical protein [Saprospiraceae bacterium]
MKNTAQLFLLFGLIILTACQSNEESVSITKEAPIFTDEAKALHYVVINLKPISLKAKEEDHSTSLKEELTSLLAEDVQAKLRVSLIAFEPEQGIKDPLLIIRRFDNLDQATKYGKMLEEKMADHDEIESILPIAQSNYRIVLKEKSFDEYQEYFKNQISKLTELSPSK